MQLSIIVPVFNMAADGKLEYCINSLLNQTISDYEILAVDDCSTDTSLEILKRFEKEYPQRLHVLHSEINRHQGGAKNIGLSNAKGDWIGFMDADDWAAPDMYEKLLSRANETGADMVGCDYHLTNEHSMKIGQIVPNNKAEQTGVLDTEKYRSLILDSGSLVVKIYKREIILGAKSRFPEHIFYEDNALCNTWMLRAKHFEYVKEPLYYYYQHEESTVHTTTKRRLEDRMQAGRLMILEAKKYGYLEAYRPEIEFSFTTLFYVNTLFSAMFAMKERGVYRFVSSLVKEMKETFPQFMGNTYYQQRVPAEEKKLIAMQLQSNLKFYFYFRILWLYRNIRKKVGK